MEFDREDIFEDCTVRSMTLPILGRVFCSDDITTILGVDGWPEPVVSMAGINAMIETAPPECDNCGDNVSDRFIIWLHDMEFLTTSLDEQEEGEALHRVSRAIDSALAAGVKRKSLGDFLLGESMRVTVGDEEFYAVAVEPKSTN